MSILIKGMEMPKDDEIGILMVYPDGYCINKFDNKIYEVVEIPKHERLIDADALESAIDKYEMIHGRLKYDFTASAPAIIEGEEE